MEKNKFNKVLSVLLEQDLSDVDAEKISDRDAMATTLDKGSKPEDFDVDLNPDNDIQSDVDTALRASQELANTISNQNEMMIRQLREWTVRMEEFVDFLNSTEGNSIQYALSKAIPDTLFDKIRIAEAKKISRTAADLASLVETFKSYVSNSTDPKYRFS